MGGDGEGDGGVHLMTKGDGGWGGGAWGSRQGVGHLVMQFGQVQGRWSCGSKLGIHARARTLYVAVTVAVPPKPCDMTVVL